MEEWRKVPGFENYEISISTKEGRCRRVFKNKKKEKVNTTSRRYIMWQLSKDGEMKTQQAARWIALTYPELVQNEWFEGAEIDHIDTDTTNNHPSNLRWVTSSGNKRNPITKLHMSKVQIGKNINCKSLSRWVIKLSLNNEILHFYPSTMQAERDTCINHTAISMCCNGKRHSAGGYIWKYAE